MKHPNRLMDPDQFSRWWDSQGTKAYREYLAQRRANLMEAWASGHLLKPEDQQEAYLCSQMSALTPDAVAHVYGVELSEEEAE